MLIQVVDELKISIILETNEQIFFYWMDEYVRSVKPLGLCICINRFYYASSTPNNF